MIFLLGVTAIAALDLAVFGKDTVEDTAPVSPIEPTRAFM
jgi:hypothetical protein